MIRSIEIRVVEPGFVVRTHTGDHDTVTDAQPVHHHNLIFVTPETFRALWPVISRMLGLTGDEK